MGGTIGTDQASTVNREAHGQILQCHIVHHLVIGALQESGIDGTERPHALRGQAGSEGDGVLFGDANVEAAFREGLGKAVNAGARWHGSGDGDDVRIALGFLDQHVAKHVLIGRRLGLRLVLGAGNHVELHHAMISVGTGFGRAIALALLRDDMDQHRAFRGVAHIFEHRQQVIEIMAIDRTDIIEAQFLKQRTATLGETAGIFIDARSRLLQRRRQHLARNLLQIFAHFQEFAARQQARQIG